VLGSLRACTVGRCTLASARKPQQTDPPRMETPSLAQPHHTQFGGEHASPLGAGGSGATLTTPHVGYGFRIVPARGDSLVAEIQCVI